MAEALARDTEIPALRRAHQSRRRSGHADRRGGPAGYHALLMSWLPGTILGKRLNAENLRKMGELFGQLHRHGAAWQPPAGFTTRRFDKMLSRGEPDVLLGDEALAVYSTKAACMIERIRKGGCRLCGSRSGRFARHPLRPMARQHQSPQGHFAAV
ncbi:MAG: phosphotransferase [Caldilineaceae bacterium]